MKRVTKIQRKNVLWKNALWEHSNFVIIVNYIFAKVVLISGINEKQKEELKMQIL